MCIIYIYQFTNIQLFTCTYNSTLPQPPPPPPRLSLWPSPLWVLASRRTHTLTSNGRNEAPCGSFDARRRAGRVASRR